MISRYKLHNATIQIELLSNVVYEHQAAFLSGWSSTRTPSLNSAPVITSPLGISFGNGPEYCQRLHWRPLLSFVSAIQISCKSAFTFRPPDLDNRIFSSHWLVSSGNIVILEIIFIGNHIWDFFMSGFFHVTAFHHDGVMTMPLQTWITLKFYDFFKFKVIPF